MSDKTIDSSTVNIRIAYAIGGTLFGVGLIALVVYFIIDVSARVRVKEFEKGATEYVTEIMPMIGSADLASLSEQFGPEFKRRTRNADISNILSSVSSTHGNFRIVRSTRFVQYVKDTHLGDVGTFLVEAEYDNSILEISLTLTKLDDGPFKLEGLHFVSVLEQIKRIPEA